MPNNFNTEANRSNANVMVDSVDHETKLFPVETKKTVKDEPPTHWNVHSDLVKAAECVAEQWNSQVDKLSITTIEVANMCRSNIQSACQKLELNHRLAVLVIAMIMLWLR